MKNWLPTPIKWQSIAKTPGQWKLWVRFITKFRKKEKKHEKKSRKKTNKN